MNLHLLDQIDSSGTGALGAVAHLFANFTAGLGTGKRCMLCGVCPLASTNAKQVIKGAAGIVDDIPSDCTQLYGTRLLITVTLRSVKSHLDLRVAPNSDGIFAADVRLRA